MANNKKKPIKALSTHNKFGQSSSRMENGQSSLQKQRKKDKKRKSLRLISGDSQELKDQQQQLNTQLHLQGQRDTRAQTLSPDKTQSLYKLDSQGNKNIHELITSPKQLPIKKNSMQIEQDSVNIPQRESKLSISSNYNSKGRPYTCDQQNTIQSSEKDSPLIKNNSLIPLAMNAAKRIQQQQPQQVQISIQGQATQLQQDARYKVLAGGQSPMKNQQPINNQSSYQLNNQPGLSQDSNYQQPPSSAQQSKHSQFQHVMKLQEQQHQQQLISSQMLQQQQFQQMVLLQQQQQQQQYNAHQVGINGLLNMTKQRGLNHQQIFNIRNPVAHRSQSSQKSSLQNNGKNIMNQKSPLYSSLNGTQKVVQGQFIPPPHNNNNNNNMSYQQTCPLSIFDINFYQSDFIMQQNKHFQGRYPGNFQQLQQQHNGFALVPNRNQMKGMVVGQQPYPKKKQKVGLQGGGFYYYDLPVQVNGKQMGMPVNYAKLQQQDRGNNFKKAGSVALLAQNPQYQYQFDPSLHNYDHEELLKQAILQEMLDNQTLPAQIMSQQDKQFFSSVAALQHQPEPLQKVPLTQVKKTSKIPFANAYVEDCYKFIVVPGNNSGLVRKAIERRDWWIEIPPVHSMYNFKWQPVSYGIKFERLSPMKPKPGEIGSGNQYSSFQGQENGQSGGDHMVMKQMVNHFEFHHFISEKANLFNMMQKQCDITKENIFDVLPVTFYVEIQDLDKQQSYNQSLQSFISFYQALEENKDRYKVMQEQIREYQQKQSTSNSTKDDDDSNEHQQSEQASTAATSKEKDFLSVINNKQSTQTQSATKVTKFRTFNFDKRTAVKYSLPMCHFNGYNLWLLKPTHLNRGRGIHVFRDLESLHKLVKEYCQGKDEEVKVAKKQTNIEESGNLDQEGAQLLTDQDQQEQQEAPKRKQSPKKSNAYKIKHNTFIIQKYIEKPMLLCNRKFDIRVWVLVDQDYDLYMFKEGYLRTSSSEFHIDLQNVDDQYVHLTNNAVQKYSEHYGQFEDGNQLGYKRFQEILDMQGMQLSVYDELVPQMKELIIKSMFAVRKKLDPFKRKHCFELFGYDFILDEDFNMWLIEVNTNPCIEESSELLKVYLPRMIEDMLKITMDRSFPKIKKHKAKKSSGTVTNSPVKNSTKVKQQLDKIEEEINENYQSANNATTEDSRLSKEAKKNSRIHPVPGYSNSENMWEKIWNLEKTDAPPNKYPNSRSEFNIHVNESKSFKLKRNPLFKRVVKEMQQIDEFVHEENKQ